MDKLFYYEIGLNLHTHNIPSVRMNRLVVTYMRPYKLFLDKMIFIDSSVYTVATEGSTGLKNKAKHRRNVCAVS